MQENKKINFIFWGTPDVASETLEILKENGLIPSFIVTSPDKPQGRKMLITPSPVKVWAEKNNIPFAQPEKLDDKFYESLKSECIFDDCISIVVAYGKIIPEKILHLPKLGSINIHYSLLPKYRGASPVESAILNGESETGVTIQKMELKMDTGPILSQEKTDILPKEKAQELRKRLIKLGGKLLVRTLPEIMGGNILATPQKEEDGTYCTKIKKEDGEIDLNDDAIKNFNKFRAYATWPRTFFFKDGKRIIITDAILEDGKLIIKKILPEGKKEISYEDFIKKLQ